MGEASKWYLKTEEWSKAGKCREDGYEVLPSSFSGTMGNLFHEEIPTVRKVRQNALICTNSFYS